MQLEDYILAHCSPEDEYLHSLYRATNLQLLRPRMASGHVQGLFLRTLISISRPKRILEIGTFSGYATLCMASALPHDGEIWTLEVNDEQEEFTRPWIENSPWASKIHFEIASAIDWLEQHPNLTFDLAYIDGNKREYIDYYECLVPRLSKGALLIADNTLWNEQVIDSAHHDVQTESIRRFNDIVAADDRVEVVILPLRDGLSLIRVK